MWFWLYVWSVLGILICLLCGEKVVYQASNFVTVLFTILCGPVIWLTMLIVWIVRVCRQE